MRHHSDTSISSRNKDSESLNDLMGDKFALVRFNLSAHPSDWYDVVDVGENKKQTRRLFKAGSGAITNRVRSK